jgi:small subunit ribosomal protein S2
MITLTESLEAGVHYGHQARRWNPKMFPYIYKKKGGIHLIDVVQTSSLLTKACNFLEKEVSKGKTVLFVGTKRQAKQIIESAALSCNSYYINHRWLGGTLTNWDTIKGRVEQLRKLEDSEASGGFDTLSKKEAGILRLTLEKLRRYLGGIRGMSKLPDIIIIVDQKKELIAIRECKKLGIPIICLADTNADPSDIDFVIPANDDAMTSIELLLGKLSLTISQATKVDAKA